MEEEKIGKYSYKTGLLIRWGTNLVENPDGDAAF